MLTKMKLTNFKSWRELELDLAPLTLLFGTNSSGKSSILQTLLLLKQTVNSFDRDLPINFGGGERDFVDLGGYRDLVFAHDENQQIDISLEWTTRYRISPAQRAARGGPAEINQLFYHVSWHQLSDRVVVDQLHYDVLSPNEPKQFFHMLRQNDNRYTIEVPLRGDGTPSYEEAALPGFEEVIDANRRTYPPPESCYGIPLIVRHRYEGDFNPYIFSRLFESLIDDVLYLGPLRHYPQRIYSWTGAASKSIGPTGENTIGLLLTSERDRTREHLRRNESVSLLEQVSEWLAKMGLVSEFQIEAIDRQKRSYETKIKISAEGVYSSLADVGFGVSQVLPIVTLLLSAPKNSIVLIEQPEIHLHPNAQAHLADLFLHVAETRNLQLIVESHSEHLLRRLQRRIAEAESTFATPENIKMYFCQAGANGSIAEDVDIDAYGQIRNWPNNFFGDITGELDALTDAALARRRQELNGG